MMKKIIRITTISLSLNTLLKGQLAYLNRWFEVIGVASGKEDLHEVMKRECVRVKEIKMQRKVAPWKDFISLLLLCFFFLKERPYIVHANTPKASLLSMMAAWITRVPHRLYTVTGLRFETETGHFRDLLIAMERVTCWCSTKVIPEGEGVKKTLLLERITNKPMDVILNGNISGIDVDYFCRTANVLNQALKIRREGYYTFCFVGRLVKDKGINELIHAFAHLNQLYTDTCLLLIGPMEKQLDPLMPEVEELISRHKHIISMGFQQDIRPYLAASDALVFPSYREGFPNVVLQAGAMGLPAIVTDINGCNEIIRENINGKIIPSKDENSLFLAMKEFYIHRNDTVLEMAANARSMIVERFEQRSVWDALLKEYQTLDL